MLNKENTCKKKVVGIIGGMGPSATALLFQKLINYTNATSDSEHMHIVIDNNTTIPDRTTAILNGDDSPVTYLCESAKKLEVFGAEMLLIPCNTSHYFYEKIQKSVSIPVINMLEETARECQKNGYNRIGLLATTGTCNTRTYERELAKFGIETIYPDEEGQSKVMEIIYGQVKAGKKIDATIVDQTLKKMTAQGAQAFVLGCTELPFAIKNGDFGYHFFDSLDILARRAVVHAGYCLKNI